MALIILSENMSLLLYKCSSPLQLWQLQSTWGVMPLMHSG
jgi:hypothetical protein